jgi:4-carboxymuconolactone decarboxylase
MSNTLHPVEIEGLAVLSSMGPRPLVESIRDFAQSDALEASTCRLSLRYAFADVWNDTGLDRKSKSLAVISALIATRQPEELKDHVRIGLANGISVAELDALVLHLSPYVGFPTAASAIRTIRIALDEVHAEAAST